MSDISVGAIRLPKIRGQWHSEHLARRVLLKILARLEVGSLEIHEGDRVRHFGDPEAGGPNGVISVHDTCAYREVLSGGIVGSGESYMQGHWSSPDPLAVIRLFSANQQVMQKMNSGKSWMRKLGLVLLNLLNRNSLVGSRRNIAAHYDLGNDFFELFLDRRMMYSSAVFPRPDASLEEAAEYKLELVCRQLDLQPEDHLLEIGTGWGGLAIYAAKNFGCHVTTTTLSREQYDYARAQVEAEGLSEQVTLLLEDYRDLKGKFDKLVSIEMVEAVGHKYYGTYFRKCSDLLKPGGLMLIQAITMADQRYEMAKNRVDFIKRYIFPGGCLPSLEVISRHIARDSDMQITALRDITADYADTLACWRERFLDALPQVREQGFDEVFQRMWEYYLVYCEGGFRERIISTVQLTFAKPGYRFTVR